MLFALALQSVFFAATQPVSNVELAGPVTTAFDLRFASAATRARDAGPQFAQLTPPRDVSDVHDSVLMVRLEEAVLLSQNSTEHALSHPRSLRLLLRLPSIIFSIWLGGALWWVSRRLFSNPGGYVALGAFCTSPWILAASAHVNAEILAAWGLFGLIFTAIGVAHTLYAPPRKWRVRIVLLGLALGFTAAAHLSAALIGFVLAAAFMLYLAPGRRLASLAILAASAAIAASLLWAIYGLGVNLSALNLHSAAHLHLSLHNLRQLLPRNNAPLLALLAVALAAFIFWRRLRYFGNFSPLLVFVVLMALQVPAGRPLLWALPFAFVFVGGIFADLFEARGAEFAVLAVLALILAQEIFCVALLAGAQNFS